MKFNLFAIAIATIVAPCVASPNPLLKPRENCVVTTGLGSHICKEYYDWGTYDPCFGARCTDGWCSGCKPGFISCDDCWVNCCS
ncbi:hypothetical protein LZ554_000940 [Drepanopeziza brunnea f. sp. 'monogermtubi']|nr:hypothetical protein LZ554_000940 [Drepanopeziza brunnea f. sp. 'monogermtubi']